MQDNSFQYKEGTSIVACHLRWTQYTCQHGEFSQSHIFLCLLVIVSECFSLVHGSNVDGSGSVCVCVCVCAEDY